MKLSENYQLAFFHAKIAEGFAKTARTIMLISDFSCSLRLFLRFLREPKTLIFRQPKLKMSS